MNWKVLVFCLLVAGMSSAQGEPKGAYLGHLSWKQAQTRLSEVPVVVIPFGAGAKEHGLHLPLNADQVVMEYLMAQAVEAKPVLIAPPILHGWFPAFREFPGTEIQDADLFRRYVQQIAESLIRHGAKRLVFFNMGIFHATGLPMAIAAREIRTNLGVPTLLVNWEDLETEEVGDIFEQLQFGHGDEIETSINLFLQPHLVDMSLASRDYREHLKKEYGGYRPGLFSLNPKDPNYSTTGVSGDPTLATAEKGEKILNIMTREWLAILDGFSESPLRK